MAGVARNTFKKELVGFIKYAPMRPSKGKHTSPRTVALEPCKTKCGFKRNLSCRVGRRIRLTPRISLTCDCFYVLNPLPDNTYYNPLAIGTDIETSGHMFQVYFSNATGMNERAFIGETKSGFGKREIRFGFNLSKVFQSKKKESNFFSSGTSGRRTFQIVECSFLIIMRFIIC